MGEAIFPGKKGEKLGPIKEARIKEMHERKTVLAAGNKSHS